MDVHIVHTVIKNRDSMLTAFLSPLLSLQNQCFTSSLGPTSWGEFAGGGDDGSLLLAASSEAGHPTVDSDPIPIPREARELAFLLDSFSSGERNFSIVAFINSREAGFSR
jgi:hypothetical protein